MSERAVEIIVSQSAVQTFPWRLLVWVALLLGGAFALVHQLGNLEELWATLRRGRAEWVALAIGL